jgi:release factor glutamine methyltransferase
MKALGEILQLTIQCFKDKNIDRPRRTAEELLAYILRLSRMDLYLHFDKPLLNEELDLLRPLIKRKLNGEPLEYLLKNMEFYGCRLLITPDALIPRPETEILLDKACDLLRKCGLEKKYVWDLCTGSGCLGIGLKKKIPRFEVILSDISENALALARKNAANNDVEVECLHGDLLLPFAHRKADIILCNPPYISNKDYHLLDRSVRDFEPKEALIGGEDGLLFYKRLSIELPFYLHPGALLFFEIGAGQGEAVRNLFLAPHWCKISIEKDWSGHERFFFLEFE